MNIARVFGDKFLKAQNVGMSSEPFIHAPLSLPPTSTDNPAYTPCIAVIARYRTYAMLPYKHKSCADCLTNGRARIILFLHLPYIHAAMNR